MFVRCVIESDIVYRGGRKLKKTKGRYKCAWPPIKYSCAAVLLRVITVDRISFMLWLSSFRVFFWPSELSVMPSISDFTAGPITLN